jgi:hypothetical protein
MRSVVTTALVGVALLASRGALAADRVAVLPFMASGGGTTSGELASARGATRDAVTQVHDQLPSDAEMASAEREVKDGVADTSAEYRAAGRAATVDWTVIGHVDVHGPTYRLELDACQVTTGRVESLAREVDPKQATSQIAEMLALLLRPQGVGDTVPPWDLPTTPAAVPVAQPPPTPVANVPPAAPLPPPPAYAENHPFALGLGGDVVTAFSRASQATGSPLAGLVTIDGAYALSGVHGLELVANLAFSVAGPSSLWIDGGARYEFPIFPRARIFLGPEVAVGAFFDLGGDKDPRFLLSGALPIVVGLGERAQIEAYPQIAYATGGTVSLGFAGGGLRAVLRF